MLQEHGHLSKEDFVYQLRVWAQVRTAFDSSTTSTAFDSLTAFYLSTSLSYLFAPKART